MATRKANQTANRKQIEATLLADATIRNAEILPALPILPAMTDRWAAVNRTVIDGLRRSGDVGGLVLATTKFVRLFVQVAILGVGAWLVVNSELTAGAMIAGSILLGRAVAPVEAAIAVWRNFIGARFSYNRLKKTIGDYPSPLKRTRLPAPRGRVVVDAVSYLTPNTAQLILSQVSCDVEPGELLAIIGPSGAGKSTLCRLMVGLAIPNVGEIRLDGSPIHHWDPAQFGRHVGFLPQDVELFAGSVRDNIARMQSVDDEAGLNAARLAFAHEMIQHLPQGYDTRIGDGGVRLSGGQRQRVGLARAVFANPQFIVLDEPNANLDQAGEAALTKAIFELKKAGVALVIVGHRPSTLSAADKILFLKEGHVAMFGQRDDVLNAGKGGSAGAARTHHEQREKPSKNARTSPPARAAAQAAPITMASLWWAYRDLTCRKV